MRYERVLRLSIVALGLIASARPASGQVSGRQNEALISASVNAAALEPSSRLSLGVGLSGSSLDWIFGAGVGVGRGALYALADKAYRERGINVGYAQLLGTRPLTPWLGASLGVDLTGGAVRRTFDLSGTAYAARISTPLALRWGAAAGTSLTAYFAPYGEIGRSPRFHYNCSDDLLTFNCTVDSVSSIGTRAFGAGAGFRLTAWRFGLDVGVREVLHYRQGSPSNNPASATLTFRF